MISKKSTIFVTGHKGLVGSAVLRRLNFFGYKNILTVDKRDLDLRNQKKVLTYFKKNKIDAVINGAALVGGIYANNKFKADFIYDNLSIQNNIIHSCFETGIKSLVFLTSVYLIYFLIFLTHFLIIRTILAFKFIFLKHFLISQYLLLLIILHFY
jgi:GDP-L-fucose synthase